MGSWTHKPEKRQALKEDRQDAKRALRAEQRPEFIVSALGDMVFDGDEWYEELLADWRAQWPDA